MIDFRGFMDVMGVAVVLSLWRYVSIFIHEAGHVLAAYAFRLPVGRLCVGEGDVLWKRRFAHTDVFFCLIPFSGAVQIDWRNSGRGRFALTIAAGPFANVLIVAGAWLLMKESGFYATFGLMIFLELLTILADLSVRYIEIDGMKYPSDGMQIVNAFRARKKG